MPSSPPSLSATPKIRQDFRSGSGASLGSGWKTGEISRGRAFPEKSGHDPLFLWTVTVCACVLATGWAGVLQPAWNPGATLDFTGDDAPGRGGMEATLEDSPPAAVEAETPENPDTPAPETVPEEPPPEPVEALTTEDVFEVPPPPPLETAARSAIPPQPKAPEPPKPKPAPRQPRPVPKPQTAPRPPAGAPGGGGGPAAPAGGTGAGNPGGGSGTGSGVKSAGKRKTPQPPYPSFARSGKMSGTVVVSVTFSPSGEAAVSLTRSCGHPALDNYTLNFIRNRWKWPGADRRTFTQDIRYSLRR